MKLKKEPVILTVIIAALIVYLVLRSNDRTNYKLPDIAVVPASEISGIDISGPSGDLSLKKTGDKWVLGPQGYNADGLIVQGMLEILEKPVIITMASESKNYGRYGLEKDKKIVVKAYSKGGVAREISIGDTTDDKRQTLICMAGDYRVYYSLKNIRTVFDKKTDDVRDKAVLSFDKNDITNIDITKGNQVIKLTKKQGQAGKADKGSAGEEKSETSWVSVDGRVTDMSSVDAFLGTISGLSCKGYVNDLSRDALGDPICTVRLTGKKEYSLSIFSGKDNSLHPAISSEDKYTFNLADNVNEEILNSADKLIRKDEKQ